MLRQRISGWILVSIFSFIGLGCAVTLGSHPLSVIHSIENQILPKSQKIAPSETEKLILRSALKIHNLPEDYSYLHYYDGAHHAASAGILGSIYVSSSFVEAYRNGTISQDQYFSVLTHEICHVRLNHTHAAASKSLITLEIDTSPESLLRRANAIAVAAYIRANGARESFSEIYSKYDTLLLIQSGKVSPVSLDLQSVAKFTLNPLGYIHSLDKEITCDHDYSPEFSGSADLKNGMQQFIIEQLSIIERFNSNEFDNIRRDLQERIRRLN